MHPFDLVRVDVRRRHLDGCRQVDDHLVVGRRTRGGSHRVTDLDGKIQLRGRKCLWTVLEHPFRFRLFRGQLPDQGHAGDGHVDHLRLVHGEDGFPKRRGRGVVNVHDGPARATDGFHGAPDQVLPRLGQDFDRHVPGNMPVFDQATHEVEIGTGGGGERNLNFLEADLAKHAEHTQLAVGVHRFEERLVAVAQVRAHPHRRCRDRAVGPLPVRQLHGRKRPVLAGRILHHRGLPVRWRRISPTGLSVLENHGQGIAF